MFINFSVKKLVKSRLFIFVMSFIIIFLCIFFNNKINIITYGKKVSKTNIMEHSFYKAEFELTVVSNKNINTYFMKETYMGDIHSFEYLDKTGNTVGILREKNTVTIKNANEKNIFKENIKEIIESPNSYNSLCGLYSILFDNQNKCGCKVDVYNKDGKTYVHFFACQNSKDNNCINIFLGNKYINKIVIELENKTNFPKTITSYDENQNTISSIVYTKFDINIKE